MVVERTVKRGDSEERSLHAIRLYGPAEVSSLLRDSGFASIELYGDWDGSPATADATRVLAVGRR
jgi:hypothetical protein